MNGSNMNEITTEHHVDIEYGIASHPRERDTNLFFEVADILDFRPEEYDQNTWGEFQPNELADAKMKEMLGEEVWLRADEHNILWLDVKECKTALCVAGHVAALNGYFPTLNHAKDQLDWGNVSKEMNCVSGQSVDLVARDLLGITGDESEILFSANADWTGDNLRQFGKGADILNYVEKES
jgi:hypothetical protein